MSNMADDSSRNDVEDLLQNEHRLTQAQLEAIEYEIKSTQPLTSHLLPISVLAQQYSANMTFNSNDDEQRGFVGAASFLCRKYASLRKVRGDGNCYYRAFLYAMCEHLLSRRLDHRADDNDDAEFRRLKRTVVESLKWVCRQGYDEYTIDAFHEELVELFDFIERASSGTSSKGGVDDDPAKVAVAAPHDNVMQQLHLKLNEENATSDYCTWFMRVMAAAQMKSNPDRYLPYVMAEGYNDVPSFCSREVEPMGKECSMVQVSALAECLGVRVVIEYMDGRMATGEERLVHHVFGGEVEDDSGENNNDDAQLKGERTSITLLYRPGHFDILY